TSLIAVLPVLGLLVIGVGLLGVGTLKDLALVQMVGILAGAMSSIFLATPLMVDLTMRRPAYRQQAERVLQRREKLASKANPEHEDEVSSTSPRARTAEGMAAGVPARVGKTAPAGRRRGHPAGKSSRPSGKAGRSSGS
ncbi:MAG TPA: protein translocase subunit SecF, partial [Pseudonocardiaceae bacterium]|nr:protein translocase subunit SecF [Pseudonocardiaceae bacterium]